MNIQHDNLPKKKSIWLLFDIDNGNSGSKHYVWWFDTRKQAREYKRSHLNGSPSKAELVGPVKATINKIPKGAVKGTRLDPDNDPVPSSGSTCCKKIALGRTSRRCLKPVGHDGKCSPYAW